jgi:hypothetical protein
MSDLMVGALSVKLQNALEPQDVREIAEAIAMLRPVVVVDAVAKDPRAQIVDAHARKCIILSQRH